MFNIVLLLLFFNDTLLITYTNYKNQKKKKKIIIQKKVVVVVFFFKFCFNKKPSLVSTVVLNSPLTLLLLIERSCSVCVGFQMADKCVNLYHCGTHATGWLKDDHPVQSDGAVLREVCFHWLDDCCYFKQQIMVRRCKHFYVYEFPGTGKSFLRYCGNGTAVHNLWKKQENQ